MRETNSLIQQPVKKVFFQYLIPTLVGMMLMSINILVDGIFVGNGVGSTALASVNIAVPVFTIILGISLWIGMGGGTLYSISIGKGDAQQATSIFSLSMAVITIITVVVGVIGYVLVEPFSLLLGANEDTKPYVIEYLSILLLFGVFMGLESSLSVFVRNDGNPNLAMISLSTTAITNIGFNYVMIFILDLGVKGAAYATVLAEVIGFFILLFHFYKNSTPLRFRLRSIKLTYVKSILSVGFPSFLSESASLVFVIGYNILMVRSIGTTGVAAFSVINYVHTFIFLAFLGIGAAIQPMISYYYGARLSDRIHQTLIIAIKSSTLIGILFFLAAILAGDFIISLFGIVDGEIISLARQGISLFFIGYVFLGFNIVYMTYFQSIGHIKPSVFITIMRGFLVLILMLIALPWMFGTPGIWLALPVSEFVVACGLFIIMRNNSMTNVTPSASN
ncbi:MATE family efflux transporter [Pontibacillus salicampi]|uniref:Multidrug export protein MepA n=1 Tax=Pontibacillus salicampi TaxID=1449801 RepID=A0ABV6LRE4_9BACI